MIALGASLNGQSLVLSVPTSPQAEAFKMYGEYGVNYSTGVPDISFPLYEINHRGYKIPISLQYVAHPLKPGYNYDVFGLGWSLSVSACISRSIEFVPDELKNFVLEAPSSSQYLNFCGNMCITDYNYGYDKFNAVLPNGSSFEFIIANESGNLVYKVSDNRQVKINCSITNSKIESFTVIDEEGVKYTFDGADIPYQGGFSAHQGSYVSWSLTRIDLPHSPEPILFNYDILMENQQSMTCDEPSVKIGHYILNDYSFNHIYTAQRGYTYEPFSYKMKLLSSISYGAGGKTLIRLNYKNATGSSLNYVNNIEVLENFSAVRVIDFGISVQPGAGNCYSYATATLDSVVVKGSNQNVAPQKYECSYLSRAYFGGTDHWGYLNVYGTDLPNFNFFTEGDMVATGQAAAAGLTPVTKLTADVTPFYKFKLSLPTSFNSDCRLPASPESHGVLRKIKYPTGGYTEFDFENHKFLSLMDNDGNYVYNMQNRVPKNAAGFRIRTITNYTEEGVVAGKKTFRYGKTNREVYGDTYTSPNQHTGLGQATVDPNILTYLDFSFYPNYFPINNMILGLNEYGDRVSFFNPFVYTFGTQAWEWQATFNALNFRKLVNGRPPVLYSDVAVYDGDMDESFNRYPLGKTVYKYDLHDVTSGNEFFEPTNYYNNTLGYEAKGFLYNKLNERADYKYNAQTEQFIPVRREKYVYQPTSQYYYSYLHTPIFPSNYAPPSIPISSLFYTKVNFIGTSMLDNKTVILYTNSGDSISTFERYSYNSRLQLSGKLTVQSDGQATTWSYRYPELTDGGPTPPIVEAMVSKNIISPVIESTTSVIPYTGTVAGSKMEYDQFGSSQALMPAKGYKLEISPSGSQYALESEVKSYSANGNPLEVVSKNDFHTAYIWDYDDRYMIAQVNNAAAAQVAYSSFESDGNGNWTFTGTVTTPASGTFVPTGRKYYNLTAATSLSKEVTNGKTYIIAYWRNVTTNNPYSITGGTGTVAMGRTVEGWTYFEHRITATSTTLSVSGTGGIDELRLYPSNAQMATYTYDPLIGVTNQSDVNNRITYYEYDGFGRLKTVRDENKNVLKTMDYQYQKNINQ